MSDPTEMPRDLLAVCTSCGCARTALDRLHAGHYQDGDREFLPLTLCTEVVAGALGLSIWGLYDLARRGEAPIEPLRLGRRLRWRTADLLALLGVLR